MECIFQILIILSPDLYLSLYTYTVYEYLLMHKYTLAYRMTERQMTQGVQLEVPALIFYFFIDYIFLILIFLYIPKLPAGFTV
jgi:hypothetical protein